VIGTAGICLLARLANRTLLAARFVPRPVSTLAHYRKFGIRKSKNENSQTPEPSEFDVSLKSVVWQPPRDRSAWHGSECTHWLEYSRPGWLPNHRKSLIVKTCRCAHACDNDAVLPSGITGLGWSGRLSTRVRRAPAVKLAGCCWPNHESPSNHRTHLILL
jgi:hypothetical protein